MNLFPIRFLGQGDGSKWGIKDLRLHVLPPWAQYHSSFSTLLLMIILFFIFTVSSLGGFIYFFADDAFYLKLGKEWGLLQSVLTPGLSGWFRPFLSFPWVVGWRLGGTSPWGYQAIISLLMVGTTFVLYKIGNLLSGRKAGLIASAFFVTYLPMIHCIWWKCSNGYSFEWFFTVLSLYFYIKFHHQNRYLNISCAFLFAIFAYFSRQSAMILFLIMFSYSFFHFMDGKSVRELVRSLISPNGKRIFLSQPSKRLMIPLLLGMTVISLYVIIEKVIFKLRLSYVGFNPVLAIQHLAIFFGIHGLFGNATFIALAGLLCMSEKKVLKHSRLQNKVVLILFGMIVGFSLARVFARFVSQELLSIDVGTVGSTFTAFLLLFVSFLISGANNKFALSWVLLSLIPNMLSELVGYAYTVVSALGMSLFLGLVFSKAQIEREPYPKAPSQSETKMKVVIASLSLLVLLLGMILKIQDVPITVEYFKYRVSTGQNEKRVLEYLSHHVPAYETVYGDRENPWLTKLRFMGKTYELGGTVSDGRYTSWMLSVFGRSDITVKPIEDLKKVANPKETFIYLYDQNNLRIIEELSDAFHFNLVKQYETWDDTAMILTLVPNGKVFPK